MNRQFSEVLRYGVNGLLATAVHFGVLTFNLKVLHLPSAGVANVVAAVFGILASFLGNRYFVFQSNTQAFFRQLMGFGGLYAVIAVFHGLILYVWTDRLGLDYRWGFLIATFFQMVLSYVGNKILIFKK